MVPGIHGPPGERPVRLGPRFSKFYWSWFGPVRDFQIFLGPGPSRSLISQIFPVLVRVGPGFLKMFGPGPVRS